MSIPATGTEARLCEMIARRQALGRAKYGVTVEENPLALREWLNHALEESLDKAVYLLRAIEEIDRREGKPPCARTKNDNTSNNCVNRGCG